MTELPRLTVDDTILVTIEWKQAYGLWCACIELGFNGLAQGCWGSEIPVAQRRAVEWIRARENYRDAQIEWRVK